MDKDLQELVDTVETWMLRRKPLAEEWSSNGMREFAEVHNAMTRKLISLTGQKNPDFWSAWMELGQQASTLTSGAKFIADGKDRTNV